nr:uncharacterized protein LOC102447377 [Pelodiscus sinensis]|eukprot:XP_006133794.1 uncharacterized protein LOC102447377 [Pelodiscus sinensis]
MASRSVTKKPIRASRWNDQETLDLIEVWSQPSIRSGLRSRKAATERKIARCMKKKGHNRNFQQCSTKMRDLKYAYFKAEKANAQPGASPERCPFHNQLHPILREDQISIPRQSVGSTPRTPNRCVENSLAQGREEQAVGNNQAANSSFRDSTDPGEGPSAGHARNLQRTRPSPAAVRRPQIHRQKQTRDDVLKEQMERSNTFLERIAAQQAGIGEQLERVVERQEEIGECLERIAEQQKGIVSSPSSGRITVAPDPVP